ncbi:MAG: hypothetical protein JST06_00865 [Bacteroidetes bacterium]|nr:hypothetical protein [Bacteroidota bacterium]MBS1630744.1 hypothetical protein [Bacteroidota bacterium]
MNLSAEERNRSTPWWWTLIPALHILAILVFANPSGIEWGIFGTQAAITAFSSWRLFADQVPYSLNKVWWIFSIVFLSAVPSAQVAVHITPWHSGDILPATMLRANGLILLCLALFEIIRLGTARKLVSAPHNLPCRPVPTILVRQFSQLTPAIILCCGVALTAVVSPLGLIYRGHLEHELWKHSTSFQLLFDKCLRGTMIWVCLAAIVLHRQHRLGKGNMWLLLAGVFVFNFPLALPRYLTLTIYLGAALAAGLSVFKKRHTFSLILLSLLLFVAPFSSITRYGGDDMGERMKRPDIVFQKAVILTDYDAWSSLCRVMQYTDRAGNTNGRQLMGVALFFVPRSVWPDKPVGSGAFLFDALHLGFNNVACTFLAEGYINFGIWGSLIFTVLLALIIARYDAWYWQQGGMTQFRLIRLFYYVAIGMLFYVLRGDLMSSFAYITGFVVVLCFWQALFFWRLRPHRNRHEKT